MNRPRFADAILTAALWFLFLTAFGAGTSEAASTMEYQGVLSGGGLIRPSAVSPDHDDPGLCVTDDGSRTLDLFDAGGFHRFRTDVSARISSPMDGSIDRTGGFVFTDRAQEGGRTIGRLNRLGEPLAYRPRPPRSGWTPNRLLIARDGHYVTLDRSGLLAKHDASTGELIWSLPLVASDSERADLLGRPAEAPDGRIYVPGGLMRAALIVSPDGRLLGSFGRQGSRRGEFIFPVAVAFDSGGRVLVLDRMRHKILLFDGDHRFIEEFGRIGLAPGDLYHPVAMAAGSDDRVYVAQGFEGRVQVFRLLDSESNSRGSE